MINKHKRIANNRPRLATTVATLAGLRHIRWGLSALTVYFDKKQFALLVPIRSRKIHSVQPSRRSRNKQHEITQIQISNETSILTKFDAETLNLTASRRQFSCDGINFSKSVVCFAEDQTVVKISNYASRTTTFIYSPMKDYDLQKLRFLAAV